MNSLKTQLLVIGCTLLSLCSHAWAAALPFGQTQTGTISSAAQTNSYTFAGSAKDVASLDMVATSGNLIPRIRIYNPVIGDLNGDGKEDIAAENETDKTVSVLLGKGERGFSPAGTCNVSADPWFIATGGFNGDGKTDLIVVATRDVNPKSCVVWSARRLLGNGDGTFQPPINTDSNNSVVIARISWSGLERYRDA